MVKASPSGQPLLPLSETSAQDLFESVAEGQRRSREIAPSHDRRRTGAGEYLVNELYRLSVFW